MNWLLLIVRLTGNASKTRVAVWRELRKIGAAPVSSGVWTVPDTPHFSKAAAKVVELASRGSGDVLVLSTTPTQPPDGDPLRAAFMTLRLDEWREFTSDCDKFQAEIAKEIHIEKFTLAELEEEEQSLERLRRWHRELKSRDVLELPEALAADELLRECVSALEGYAEQVYATLHTPTEPEPSEIDG